MKIRCRNYTTNDIDELVEFWNESSGWDIIDSNEWKRRFFSTPLGESFVALAIDNSKEEIVGQFVFIASIIMVDGEPVKGFRPFAPVVKQALRTAMGMLTLIEVVMKMYNYAIGHFKRSGVGIVHMLPDPRWARAFKYIPGVQMGHFPLWSIPLPLKQSYQIPLSYEVKHIAANDERIDGLWQKSRHLYGCSVPRNTITLPWKTSHGDFFIIGIFYSGELVGLSASIAKPNDRQWLICDMLTEDGDQALKVTIQATSNLANRYRESHPDSRMEKVAILATPLIANLIGTIDFKPDAYRFPMVVQLLDEKLSKKQISPERWYASAND
jgi:hypothetical protein